MRGVIETFFLWADKNYYGGHLTSIASATEITRAFASALVAGRLTHLYARAAMQAWIR